MKQMLAGLLTAFLTITGGVANAVSLTPPGPVTPGTDIEVTGSAPVPGLEFFDLFLDVPTNTMLIGARNASTNGGVANYQGALASSIALTNGQYYFNSAGLSGPFENGFDGPNANGLIGIRVNGIAASYDTFKLMFSYTPTGSSTVLNYYAREYTNGDSFYTSGSITLVAAPAIPLPAGAPLALSGLAALALLRRRKARAA